MKKTLKLKKNYEFNNTFKRGKFFGGELIECICTKHNKKINYIGIAIGSKVCKAVKRNRIKRVIKEAYRNLEENISTGFTFVFLWNKKKGVEECNYHNVKQDMIQIFKRIGIYKNEQNNDLLN